MTSLDPENFKTRVRQMTSSNPLNDLLDTEYLIDYKTQLEIKEIENKYPVDENDFKGENSVQCSH